MIQEVNHFKEFESKFDKFQEKATYIVSSQILADCNRHARRWRGDLINSSIRASNLKKGELIWDTPYAKKVYFTGEPNNNSDHNPEAVLLWCDYAYQRYGKDWLRIVENLLKETVK